MNPTDDRSRRLERLHEHYVREVNMAVARGDDDLIEQLVSDYVDESLRVLLEPTAGAS